MLKFEAPLTERVRSFLKIEQLFQRFNQNLNSDDPWAHHVALTALLELAECASQKMEILQELERQRQKAIKNQNDELFQLLSQTAQTLQEMPTSFALRQNEWLMAFKQKLIVPAGTTATELPSYHFWQNRHPAQRQADLKKWVADIQATGNAIDLLMEILRNNQEQYNCVAPAGNYQQPSQADIQLLTIVLERNLSLVPEVTANKYVTNVRFLTANQENSRGKQTEQDIHFQLILNSF